jgi:hypothetical protein
MLFSAVLRAAPYLPLILYLVAIVVFAARSDSDVLRLVLSCAGSFLLYFYFALATAALVGLSPLTRILVAYGFPVILFLLLAGLDLAAPPGSGTGGFISLDINFKMMWAIPGMFLSRMWFRLG